MLNNLPTEIFEKIVRHIPSFADRSFLYRMIVDVHTCSRGFEYHGLPDNEQSVCYAIDTLIKSKVDGDTSVMIWCDDGISMYDDDSNGVGFTLLKINGMIHCMVEWRKDGEWKQELGQGPNHIWPTNLRRIATFVLTAPYHVDRVVLETEPSVKQILYDRRPPNDGKERVVRT